MAWWYWEGQEKRGPYAVREMEDRLRRGELTEATIVQSDDMPAPQPLDQTLLAQALRGGQGPAQLMREARLAEEEPAWWNPGRLLLDFKRVLRTDIASETVAPWEEKRLVGSGYGGVEPLVGNYLCWRRGVLVIAGICFGIGAIFALISLIDLLADDTVPEVFYQLQFVLFMLAAGPVGLIWQAARNWAHPSRSLNQTLWGWLVLFFGPFLVFLMPIHLFLGDGVSDLERFGVALVVAPFFVLFLLSKVFSLFPALLRAGISLKTVLPESAAPGWICLILAPLYALFYLLMVVFTVQLALHWSLWVLAFGFAMFTITPLVVFRNLAGLMEPMDADMGHQLLLRVKRDQFGVSLAGMIAVLVFFLGAFGSDFLANMDVEPVQLASGTLQLVAGLYGNYVLVTVVLMDVITRLVARGLDKSIAPDHVVERLRNRLKLLSPRLSITSRDQRPASEER